MPVRYACAPVTEHVTITITQEQAKLLHSALCDASLTTRDHQLDWLNAHENCYLSADQRGEAWVMFKQWERRENLTVQLLDLLRQTGIELDQRDYGLR